MRPRRGYLNPHEETEMQRIQCVLDESDPFFVESLQDKTDEQLMETMDQVEKNYDVASRSENREFMEYAKRSLNTFKAFMQMKKINENIKRDLKNDEDDVGGVTLV